MKVFIVSTLILLSLDSYAASVCILTKTPANSQVMVCDGIKLNVDIHGSDLSKSLSEFTTHGYKIVSHVVDSGKFEQIYTLVKEK